VLIGMTTSPGFHRWDTDGVIDVDEPVVPQRRHAVVGVAVGERKGRRLLMIRNSWGGHVGPVRVRLARGAVCVPPNPGRSHPPLGGLGEWFWQSSKCRAVPALG
jgi:hypothetical protein